MSYLIDILILAKEAIKLVAMAVISPFGLIASYLLAWQV